MAPRFQAPKGTYDVLPSRLEDPAQAKEPWTNSGSWHFLERHLHEWAKRYGFGEIRTPLFESTELFQRAVGEVTDIVGKEMYTFEDRGGRSMTLRPEGTAPCIRALLEGGRLQPGATARVYYIEPMFRYERPQAGRFRQHAQFGAEWFGSSAPEAEVELIRMMWDIMSTLGLGDLKVCINSIGTAEDRQKYRQVLLDALQPKQSQLSPESQERLLKNPLRILDSKHPGDQELVAALPQLLEVASKESQARFQRVTELLTALHVPYSVSPQLVRGFDYYTHTVWEIVASGIGAQSSLGGGGRYDHLVHELGGPPMPGAGFGIGIERLLSVLAQGPGLPSAKARVDILIVSLDPEASVMSMEVAGLCRRAGLATEWQPESRKLKTALAKAAEAGIPYVLLIGEEEQQQQAITWRDMVAGEQKAVPLAALPDLLKTIERVSRPTAGM